jgi:2'-5' RNA ligase
MQPGDRLVCAFVKPLEKGAEFKDWPLHVTIVPWFRTEASSDELTEEFGQTLAGISAFDVEIDGETRFGRNKLVNLVAQPTPFMDVEMQVRGILKSHDAWIADETTKRTRSYRPHVTEQKTERLHKGDTFVCAGLYLVEQLGGTKQATELINFKNP